MLTIDEIEIRPMEIGDLAGVYHLGENGLHSIEPGTSLKS